MRILLVHAFLIGAAYADLPPPAGYVEQCTVEKQKKKDESCTTCSANHSSREACLALEKQGFKERCKTRGASVWTEVWCKPAQK